jgi:uncharacterized FlgJ-related protein
MMQELEFKKILEVQKGVALLREMREKQENIRIEQEKNFLMSKNGIKSSLAKISLIKP